MVTIDDFKVRFDEFNLDDATDPLNIIANDAQNVKIEAVLAAAEAQVDRTIFPSSAQADEAVMYLTAHLLARGLSAVNARLQKSRGDDNLVTGEDVYWSTYERIARAATGGLGRTT